MEEGNFSDTQTNNSSEEDTEIVDVPTGEVVKYASKEKIEKFEKRFPELAGQDLILSRTCTLERDGLPRGHLMITRTHFCFYSSHIKKIKIALAVKDVVKIKKGGLLPNSIKVETNDGTKLSFGFMGKRDAVFNLMEIIAVGEGSIKKGESSSDEKEEEGSKTEDKISKTEEKSSEMLNIKSERRKSSNDKTKADEAVSNFFKKLSIDIQGKKYGSSLSPVEKSPSAKGTLKKKKKDSAELSNFLQKMVINQLIHLTPEKLDEMLYHSNFKFQYLNSASVWESIDGKDQRNVVYFLPPSIATKPLEKKFLGKWVGVESYTIKEKGHYVIQSELHPESGEFVHISITITITAHDSDQKDSRITAQMHLSYQDKDLESLLNKADEFCTEFIDSIRQQLETKEPKTPDTLSEPKLEFNLEEKEKNIAEAHNNSNQIDSTNQSNQAVQPLKSELKTLGSSSPPKKIPSIYILYLVIIVALISLFALWYFSEEGTEKEFDQFITEAKQNPRVHLDEIIELQKKLQERVIPHNEVSRILRKFQLVEDQLEKLTKM